MTANDGLRVDVDSTRQIHNGDVESLFVLAGVPYLHVPKEPPVEAERLGMGEPRPRLDGERFGVEYQQGSLLAVDVQRGRQHHPIVLALAAGPLD